MDSDQTLAAKLKMEAMAKLGATLGDFSDRIHNLCAAAADLKDSPICLAAVSGIVGKLSGVKSSDAEKVLVALASLDKEFTPT